MTRRRIIAYLATLALSILAAIAVTVIVIGPMVQSYGWWAFPLVIVVAAALGGLAGDLHNWVWREFRRQVRAEMTRAQERVEARKEANQ